MFNKKYIVCLLLTFCTGLAFAAETDKPKDLESIADKRIKFEKVAKQVFDKVQLDGIDKLDKVFEQAELQQKEQLASLRLAAQIAHNNGDKITRDLLKQRHDDILYRPSWLGRGTGLLGKAAKIGIQPVKKGFDGACYVMGALCVIPPITITLAYMQFLLRFMRGY